MKKVLLATLLLGIAAVLPANGAGQPPRTTEITVTDDSGQPIKVKLNKRELLRVKTNKRFALNMVTAVQIPAPPAEFDLTIGKDGKMLNLPMHGNDRYGDCYPVACFHLTEFQLGFGGKPTVFKDADIIRDYFRMSPNDQGTSDSDIIPWWKQGIPSNGGGANKLIDFALVDPADDASYYAAMYYLGGVVTTHELRGPWESINGSGFVWDNTGSIDPNAGHAVTEGGRKLVNGRPMAKVLTWGMYGWLTKEGRTHSDCEVVAVVTSSWFNAAGYTPNGDHYDDIAVYWKGATNQTLPTGLYPPKKPDPPKPPTPPNPPLPPVGQGFTGTITYTYVNGTMRTPVVTPNLLPVAEPGKPYVIDLSKYGPFVRMRLKHKLLAVIDDDRVIVTDNGDSITIAPKPVTLADGKKGSPDWNAFLDFLEKLIPLILKIMALFGA